MPRDVPPPLEMLCLNALWSIREGNVADVRRQVAGSRPLAYTTVMTLLERLARKGTISRRKVGRAFYYAPAVSRDALRGAALRQFVDCFFDGSTQQLAAFIGGLDEEPSGILVEVAPGMKDEAAAESTLDASLL